MTSTFEATVCSIQNIAPSPLPGVSMLHNSYINHSPALLHSLYYTHTSLYNI